MLPLRVLTVVGTRPEAIKMAPVIKALEADPGTVPIVCLTGQHAQMVAPMISLFKVQVDYRLETMKRDQNLSDVTCGVLDRIAGTLRESKPDVLLVQGDTTSAMAAALGAFYEKIPVGHVEAGLRTGNLLAPWPEEANRKLISAIATLHFAPTDWARQNLLRENIPHAAIAVTGNTVIDALLTVKRGIESDPDFLLEMEREFPFAGEPSGKRLGRNVILVTGHRRESFGRGFENICTALRELAKRNDVQIVYSVHLNPNVRAPVNRILGGVSNVHLIEPIDYRRFVYLMSSARIILTDSGGIQEEAPALGKPVLVMREVTERPEAVASGTVSLVGTDAERIVSETVRLLDDTQAYEARTSASSPYGDGNAGRRILETLLSWQKRRMSMAGAASA